MEKREIIKIVVFPSYYLNFLAKIPFALQANWYKRPDSRMERLLPENIDFSLVDST